MIIFHLEIIIHNQTVFFFFLLLLNEGFKVVVINLEMKLFILLLLFHLSWMLQLRSWPLRLYLLKVILFMILMNFNSYILTKIIEIYFFFNRGVNILNRFLQYSFSFVIMS